VIQAVGERENAISASPEREFTTEQGGQRLGSEKIAGEGREYNSGATDCRKCMHPWSCFKTSWLATGTKNRVRKNKKRKEEKKKWSVVFSRSWGNHQHMTSLPEGTGKGT